MTVTDEPVGPNQLSDPPGWSLLVLLGLLVVPTAHALAVRGGSSRQDRRTPRW